MAAVHEIACASGRVTALILGYADLGVSLGRPPECAAEVDRWPAIQDMVLVAARAAGIQAIDGAFLNIADEADLRRWAARVAALGFDGKWVIHLVQVIQ